MATESFLKNVTIKSPFSARRLVRVIEATSKKKDKEVRVSRTVEHLGPDKIRDFFGDV